MADKPLFEPTPITTADGSLTLFSPRYGESFRSQRGAMTESAHVFLRASGVEARLQQGLPTRVLEVGWGPATNFTTTASMALASGATLVYEAWEIEPLPADALQAAGLEARLPGGVGASLLRAREGWGDATPGSALTWSHAAVSLTVQVASITAVPWRAPAFHAIYHDPFSPDVNPEAWTDELLQRLASQLLPGGMWVSYSVQGRVRRALTAAGLTVVRLPGPPEGKRQMLRAEKPAS